MTLKRIFLSLITIIVVFLVSSSLISSLSEPQVTSRLQLYQTDLLLQATEWNGGDILDEAEVNTIRSSLLGEKPLKSAIDQYEEVRTEAQTNLARSQSQLEAIQPRTGTVQDQPAEVSQAQAISSPSPQQLQRAIQQLRPLIQQLDLRLGILQTQVGQTQTALETWSQIEATPDQTGSTATANTAQVLIELWSDPPRLTQETESRLQQNLDGWFRFRALERLYELQQRETAIAELVATEQARAEQTFIKLAVISFLPTLGCLIGIGLIIFLVVQVALKGKQSAIAQNASQGWSTPWDWETIWLVLIVGFFFVGQVVLPILLGSLGLSGSQLGGRGRAIYSLAYYLLMASGGIAVLVWAIRPHFPLPEDWFKFKWWGNWPLWGFGGYFVALPIMIGVSLLNQQIWQGQGGSNPLLQTVLEEGDTVALVIFFLTAAIAAPLFEEVLFRGFLLPSLTRYMSAGWAIVVSSFIFAVAHLSLSEVIPLMTLGIVLGFIYTRSRNLLAPMLLHSLWNSATMIGLFILGSGTR